MANDWMVKDCLDRKALDPVTGPLTMPKLELSEYTYHRLHRQLILAHEFANESFQLVSKAYFEAQNARYEARSALFTFELALKTQADSRGVKPTFALQTLELEKDEHEDGDHCA
jgi:hypothetical protein